MQRRHQRDMEVEWSGRIIRRLPPHPALSAPSLQHRCEYALAGDMVNLAARLAARADMEREGCVLCDQFTIQVLTSTTTTVVLRSTCHSPLPNIAATSFLR